MKKRNISVLIIILSVIIITVCIILVTKAINDSLSSSNITVSALSAHFTVMFLIISILDLVIIMQAIRLIERKPDMYKYDIPVAIMSERAEQIKIQQNKNELYAAIVQTLSDEYEAVYFVDIETEDYLKYTRHEEYKMLWLDKHSHYFFTEIYRFLMKKRIDKAEMNKLSEEITKDNILSVLSENSTATFKFNTNKSGTTNYYIIKIVYFMDKATNHIVVGIQNINSWIQSENEYKEAVGQAIEMAIIDDLTSVKNRNAYVKHEQELDMAIESDSSTEFALVVLDVNGLKHINDTLGHKSGDALLKKASALICEVYAGNAIYRIGGDEFAVILLGDKYNDRFTLLEQFRERVLENMDKGDVVIASGMSTYTPDIDPSAESVFDRADAAMYENKLELKKDQTA